LEIKQHWAPFCPDFQDDCRDFPGIWEGFLGFCPDFNSFCRDFHGFFPDFRQIKTFGGALAPASCTTAASR